MINDLILCFLSMKIYKCLIFEFNMLQVNLIKAY